MPTRIIRDGILDSIPVNSLSDQGELFYRRLMSVVDDYGRFDANPTILRARCFPLQLERWPISRINEALGEVASTSTEEGVPLVLVYSYGQKNYLEISKFGQRIRPGTSSKYPAPTVREMQLSRGNSPHFAAERGGAPQDAATRGDSREPAASRARTPTSSHAADFSERESAERENSGGMEVLLMSPPSRRFSEWWALWSSVKGTNQRMSAEGVYPREVTVSMEADCFECTRSYLASLDNPTKGYNPQNFLVDQGRDKFQARWPARSPPRGQQQCSDAELASMIDEFGKTRHI